MTVTPFIDASNEKARPAEPVDINIPGVEFEPFWGGELQVPASLQPWSTHNRRSEQTTEARIAEAFAEGVAHAKRQAQHDADARADAEQARSEQLLRCARADWTATEGQRLASLMESGMASLEARVRRDVAAILETWLMRALDSAAVNSFVSAVESTIGQAARCSVTIHGRQDLAEAVSVELAIRGIGVAVVATETGELRAQIDETLVATELCTVAAQLAEGTP